MKIRIGNDYNSDRYLAYTDMGLNDWMICYVIPVSEAQKSYNFVRRYELIFTIGFCVMVSMLFLWGFVKNRSKDKQLIQAAETDALTSAYNKRSTEERIHNVLQEHPQEPGTFVIMDVDHFKEVNDIYGHITGDKVLHKFGEVLHEHFREGDIVGRIGGDEFVVYMRKTDSREVAVSRIESLIKKVEELSFTEMNGKNITISAGMAFAPEHGTGYLDLYKNADTALYKTKQNGRDGYNIYEEEKDKDKGERKGYAYWNNYQCIIHSYRRNLGAFVGHKLSPKFKEDITLVFGVCSMGMGISTIGLMENMPAVIFSVVIGTGIGLAIHLGERINAGAGVMQRVIGKFIKNSNSELSEDEFMNTLVTIIVLFCASGTGIYGSIVSGMSGDHSVLISKSILDLFTAAIFACSLGMVVCMIAIPQVIIFLILFFAATAIFPLTTPGMINDFKACGGFLMLATGFRMVKLKNFPTADMIPAMVLIMPMSCFWVNYILPLVS